MSTLCPHLFQAYLSKASDILDLYEPQIISVVRYDSISRKLIHRKVLKRREHRGVIEQSVSENDKMGKVLEILRVRMWGLENLITILIEQKLDNWLAEELFQAYVRHLVTNMKKVQSHKVCNCVQTGTLSLMQCSWFVLLEELDKWLMDIGSSLGCLAVPLHPVKNLLGFIRHRLNVDSRVKILRSVTNLQSSDSEESDEEHLDSPLPQRSRILERSVSAPILPSPRSYRRQAGQGMSRSFDSTLKSSGSCPEVDINPELEWDEEADLEALNFNLETDYIFELLKGTGNSSVSSSCSSSSYGYRTNEMASQTTLYTPQEKVSTSTQTTPVPSPPPTPLPEIEKIPVLPEIKPTPSAKVLPNTNSQKNPKVATVNPKRRVTEVRKTTGTSPTSPVHKDRLKPEDYGKWSNVHLSKTWKNNGQNQGGTNVA